MPDRGLERNEMLVTQLCATLCDPHGLGLARLFCPWDSSCKNTGVGCHFFLQGIFLTQGSNPGLLYCRQILCRLSHLQGLVAKETSWWWKVGMGTQPQPSAVPLQAWGQDNTACRRDPFKFGKKGPVTQSVNSPEVSAGPGLPGGSDGKESACNIGDLGSIPGLERSPGERNSYPLQYSGLENSMDRAAWHAIVHASQRVRHNFHFTSVFLLTFSLLE